MTLMKAAVVPEANAPWELRDVPKPEVGPHQVLVKILAVVTVATLGACTSDPPAATPAPSVATSPPAAPSTSVAVPTSAAADPETPAAPTTRASPARPGAVSDVSQLKRLGIDIGGSVLLDVADDGVDRFLQVGKNRVVDFTGTTRTDSTMMALQPAPVQARNRVVIKPPFWNEDLGAGSCVADTTGAPLQLETCRPGKASQVWQVVPAGDSGQFELRGAYGILHVDNGKLTTADSGRTGLQTLKFAR